MKRIIILIAIVSLISPLLITATAGAGITVKAKKQLTMVPKSEPVYRYTPPPIPAPEVKPAPPAQRPASIEESGSKNEAVDIILEILYWGAAVAAFI